MEVAKHNMRRRRHWSKPGNFVNGYAIYQLPGFACTAVVPDAARAHLAALMGTPFWFPQICRAGAILRELEGAVPVFITVFPLDSASNPAAASAWFATTRGVRFDCLPPRLPDPEYLAQGRSPLGAVIALFTMNIRRGRWRVRSRPNREGYSIDVVS